MWIRCNLSLALAVVLASCATAGTASEIARAAPALAPCEAGGTGSSVVRPDDVAVGPLILMSARDARSHPPDAFGGLGYKIPATLPAGTVATLSVPRALRPHVRLVYSRSVQDGVHETGIGAGSRAVRFAACAAGAPDARTGWTGGILVDRPRCVTLRIRVDGESAATSHRVPLGRRCR